MKAEEPGLLTDLYELTMAQAYYEHGMFAPATFSLFIRQYPPGRSFFVAAGLEDVLTYLEGWRFPRESIDYLHSTGTFSSGFLDYLSKARFTGDVWAVPGGRLFFADEPVLEVTGPIIEAQLVETYLIYQINFQNLIATQAARCVWAARGRSLVDFSFRRTHGVEAGLKAARASYIAGFQSTSNVSAGKLYSIPISGTMAHSFVSSHRDELDAFRSFAESFPTNCVVLIDTYDTIAGAKKAAVVGQEMEKRGQRMLAVRLDSEDLAELSVRVRKVLDEAGLDYVGIVATGGLDEIDVEEITRRGAPIDGFGLGTRLGVSSDAPWSDMAYKLVRYDGRPVLKLSTGKVSLPDEKQVLRLKGEGGGFTGDVIALRNEAIETIAPGPEPGEALLWKVMEGGRSVGPRPSPKEIRDRFDRDFGSLDERFKALRDPPQYPVNLSPRLRELFHRMKRELAAEDAALPRGAQEQGERLT